MVLAVFASLEGHTHFLHIFIYQDLNLKSFVWYFGNKIIIKIQIIEKQGIFSYSSYSDDSRYTFLY